MDDSVANFVLIHFPPPGAGGAKVTGGEKTAAEADAFLTRHGVILRQVGNYGLPDCLRMTVGTEEQNRLAVSLLQEFMAA